MSSDISKDDIVRAYAVVFRYRETASLRVDFNLTLDLKMDQESLEIRADKAKPKQQKALAHALLPIFESLARKANLHVVANRQWCAVSSRTQSKGVLNRCTAFGIQHGAIRTLANLRAILEAALDTLDFSEPIITRSNIISLHDKRVVPDAVVFDPLYLHDAALKTPCNLFARPWFLEPKHRNGSTWSNAVPKLSHDFPDADRLCMTEIISKGLCMSLSLGQALSEIVYYYDRISDSISSNLRAIVNGVSMQEDYVSSVITATFLHETWIRSVDTAIDDFLSAFAMVQLGKEKPKIGAFLDELACSLFVPELRVAARAC